MNTTEKYPRLAVNEKGKLIVSEMPALVVIGVKKEGWSYKINSEE